MIVVEGRQACTGAAADQVYNAGACLAPHDRS